MFQLEDCPGREAQLVGGLSRRLKGLGFDSGSGSMREATSPCFSHIHVSLSFPSSIDLGNNNKMITRKFAYVWKVRNKFLDNSRINEKSQ